MDLQIEKESGILLWGRRGKWNWGTRLPHLDTGGIGDWQSPGRVNPGRISDFSDDDVHAASAIVREELGLSVRFRNP